MDFLSDPRFTGIKPFENRVWLSSPTMHGDEQKWVDDAIKTNWVSTVGENINKIEKQVAEFIGIPYTVALSAGTAALHLAVKLCGQKLYGQPEAGHGTLEGRKVFCSDLTFAATEIFPASPAACPAFTSKCVYPRPKPKGNRAFLPTLSK